MKNLSRNTLKMTLILVMLTASGCNSATVKKIFQAIGNMLVRIRMDYRGPANIVRGQPVVLDSVLGLLQDDGSTLPIEILADSYNEDVTKYGAYMQVAYSFHAASDCSDAALDLSDSGKVIQANAVVHENGKWLIAPAHPIKIDRLPNCSDLVDGVYVKTYFPEDSRYPVSSIYWSATCRKVMILPQ